jgi:NAD(P)H-hydrate epimerase
LTAFYPQIKPNTKQWLDLEVFKKLDYYAVNNLGLPIELMMENAGLNLARIIVQHADKKDEILIGVGNGNNGGGGLVAARRLAAWGYSVSLDMPMDLNKELVIKQWERAKSFGVREGLNDKASIWVDA